MSPSEYLHIHVRRELPRRAILVLRGELDHASAGDVRATVGRVAAEGVHEVVLDLSGLSFMDAGGLHLLHGLRDGRAGAHCTMVDGSEAEAFGQLVVTEVRELLLRQPRCSTEQHMGRDSIVALVRHRRGQVGELALRGSHRVVEVDDGAELHQFLQRLRVVGHRPVHVGVDRSAAQCPDVLERLPGQRVGAIVCRVHQRDA